MSSRKILRFISWNVNGVRAVQKAKYPEWFARQDADFVCLQEIKANPEQVEPHVREPTGYIPFWNPAAKPGYSGTATFARETPLEVHTKIGLPEADTEGRVLALEYKDYVLINAYFPNSQREHTRLPLKLEFCMRMKKFCDSFVKKGKHIILCGDYNIAHREIDLRNPKQNVKNAGFLPEERAWMDQFLTSGYADPFRRLHGDALHRYTWWSYRPGIRERNIGWRLDYHCVNEALLDRVKTADHQPEVKGSDHCPVVLELKK